jgi:electron transfer flavoprotein alpha subunit
MKYYNQAMKQNIYVIAEHNNRSISPSTYESLNFAMELNRYFNQDIIIIILGLNIENLARELRLSTGKRVVCIENDNLFQYNCELYKTLLYDHLKDKHPLYIIIPHSANGIDYGPGLSVKLNADSITSVEKIEKLDNQIYLTRSIYSGKISMKQELMLDTTVIMIVPGMFGAENTADNEFLNHIDLETGIEVNYSNASCQSSLTYNSKAAPDDDLNMNDARVIISAGKGIGKQENLDLIFALARRFSRSAVGCSRIICDLGWLGYKHQIGITGKTVSPQLYLACGISGANQHISGMRGSHCIIAINTDEEAAIFSIADVVIIEDLTELIQELLDQMDQSGWPWK